MEFDKNSLELIRKELNDVLSKYGVRHDLEFKIGNISYQENSFKTSLECFNTEGGQSAEKIAFDKNCYVKNVPSNWYGKIIQMSGKDYMIAGVNTRGRKYPIMLKNVLTGVVDMKCDIGTVRTKLQKPVFIECDTKHPDAV
jgi:hypothetical protein